MPLFIIRTLCMSAFVMLVTTSLVAADLNVPVTLAGQVVDQNRSAVAGARVIVARIGSSIKKEVLTDGEGSFLVELPAGQYTFSVAAEGFELHTSVVQLQSDQRSHTVMLDVASATAIVTISDDAIYGRADIVSATRTYTPVRDIPQSITLIKKDQIVDQQMSSIAQVVQYVPGISSHQGENNRDDVIIRGNRSSADFYRDGVRDDVQYYRDLYNLDRVEALKGPNAMVFGRGGGGGVINRVTKEARFSPVREFTANVGSFGATRFTGDVGQSITAKTAFRLNGVYDRANSFRRFVRLNRFGINPTFTFTPNPKTNINIGYEYYRDRRTADRGMTSFMGRPADVPISTFYGDPNNSRVRSGVHLLSGSVERLFGNLIFRNKSSYGDYDRFYQNYVPGAVNAAGTLVSISSYNNATVRKNLFDQTDLTYYLKTGSVKHTLLGGTEFGRQITENFRQTGFFNNTTTTLQVPFGEPTTSAPITYRQSNTDANNDLRLNLAAAFVQDQIEFSRYVQAIVGVRYDYFDLNYHNRRTEERLRRVDKKVSPRFGLVIKPISSLSLYGSYSVSYLPSSGDQFSALTNVTQQVKPEQFTNTEFGVKWDIRSGLALTAAIYRLDRANTRATDPGDPARIIQTGRQRSDGLEIGLSGNVTNRWSVSGGYAHQNARITSATTAAPAGRKSPQVPRDSFSLWNKVGITKRFSGGVGLHYRSEVFAAIDNTVRLPGYVRADAAVFYTFNERWRLQANLENLTDKRYYANADNNTNISPGIPRSLKVAVIARF